MADYISNSVYMWRTKHGLTQEELAKHLGVTRQTVISIEKGRYTPSVFLALKIGKVFRARVEDIFKISHEK